MADKDNLAPFKDAPSPSERVSAYFKKLATAAVDLNVVSDELGKPISLLDEALKGLNLGIETWVEVVGGNGMPNDEWFWEHNIGYAKVNGRWGIALRTQSGYYSDPDASKVDTWLFNEAPRANRLEAADKIPDLLEKLLTDARRTAESIKKKVSDVQQLADAV